ncbi:Leucine-rich repeat-containing protein 51 [Lobulomyces angularis]|nr:Leucine-rich repeat-containing protein 51 [Lobulomyces angularis]
MYSSPPYQSQNEGKISQSWAKKNSTPLDFSFKDIPALEDILDEELQKQHQTKFNEIQKAIKLSNNRLSSLENLYNVLSSLLDVPEDITWMDLSFNQLTTIDEVLLKFPNLSSLNLHANSIRSITEIDKLTALKNLKHLTLHGNPIEMQKKFGTAKKNLNSNSHSSQNQQNSQKLNLKSTTNITTMKMGLTADNPLYYRYYVISKLPNLIQLDFCAITKQDRLTALDQSDKLLKKKFSKMTGGEGKDLERES